MDISSNFDPANCTLEVCSFRTPTMSELFSKECPKVYKTMLDSKDMTHGLTLYCAMLQTYNTFGITGLREIEEIFNKENNDA